MQRNETGIKIKLGDDEANSLFETCKNDSRIKSSGNTIIWEQYFDFHKNKLKKEKKRLKTQVVSMYGIDDAENLDKIYNLIFKQVIDENLTRELEIPFNSRIEIESLHVVLKMLGLEEKLSYQKKRFSYTFRAIGPSGEIEHIADIHIDKLPKIGYYLAIATDVHSSEEKKDLVLIALGLQDKERIDKTFKEIVQENIEDLDIKSLVFPQTKRTIKSK
jgi:adenylate cyclase class IV